MTPRWVVAVHGGAGAMRAMTPAKEATYRAGLATAARAAGASLEAGGSAVHACLLAVHSMEASGAFNAGLGACLNATGAIEVDAAVMRARDGSVGAVGAVPGLGNACQLAEAVRTESPYCLLVGEGALRFAHERGLPVVDAVPDDARRARFAELSAKRARAQPQRAEDLTRFGGTHDEGDTVGAVALDANGELATAVSTGGIWLKQTGRVGDSPLAGAGFWAEDGVGAAVATGTGELIMRTLLSATAVGNLRAGMGVDEAGQSALAGLAARFGPGRAGLIVVDGRGRVALPFDTEGMGRAVWRAGEPAPRVAVWPDEEPA